MKEVQENIPGIHYTTYTLKPPWNSLDYFKVMTFTPMKGMKAKRAVDASMSEIEPLVEFIACSEMQLSDAAMSNHAHNNSINSRTFLIA